MPPEKPQDSATSPKVKTPARDASLGTASTQHTVGGLRTQTFEGDAGVSATISKVGRFEIRALLGEGAFGKVYRARDPHLDREVALKVPQPGVLDSVRDLERFLREAKAAATIQHPNICPVYEVGQENGNHFIVMAYVPGQSLAGHLKSRKTPLPAKQAVAMVRKLALALQVAHDKGIVHRDLKPGNILIDSERKELVITDFGLARRANVEEAQLTQSGAIMGTPAYMSPEQARGEGKGVGPQSDIYGLGVIFYELLAGRRPFNGSVAEVLGQLLHVEPDAPRKLRPDLDPSLSSICMKAMAKDAAKRFASMKDLAAALGEWMRGSAMKSDEKTVDPAAATAPAETDTKHLRDMMRDMADERKAEREALIEAVAARSRVPVWAWIAGAGLVAAIVLLGIIFFARTPTAMVLIHLDVNLDDKALSFFLDGKEVAAAELKNPIELKVGEHELIVKRGEEVVRKYKFGVSKDAGPRIELRDESPPPKREDPDNTDGFTPLFNGKDLTGWKGVMEGNAEEDKTFYFKDGVLVCTGKPNGYLLTGKSYGNYLLRFECRFERPPDLKDDALFNGNSGVFLHAQQGPGRWPKGVELQGFHRDLGKLFEVGEPAGGFQFDGEALRKARRPVGEWNAAEVECRDGFLRAKVNGAEVSSGQASMAFGAIGIQSEGSLIEYRRFAIKELPADAGWVPLFNGKDLKGWKTHPDSPGDWKVEGGELVGRGPKRNHLFTERDDFADFHFLVECKINAKGNSGQELRCKFMPGIPEGYEAQIDSGSHGNKTGTLYILPSQKGKFVKEVLVPPDTWYTQEVIAKGNQFTIKVNGKVVTEFTDPDNTYTRGHLGLQLWDAPTEVRFKRIWVKVLPPAGADGFKPLFNGKDLTGWEVHPGGVGDWKIEDGAIVGSGKLSNLFTKADAFADFHVRVNASINDGGNSGLYFRSQYQPAFPKGYEAQINSSHQDPIKTGSLYPTMIPHQSPERGKLIVTEQLVKPDEWFDLDVICQGNRIIIKVNGKTTVDFMDEKRTYASGRIALQQHHAGSVVKFRKVEVKELKPVSLVPADAKPFQGHSYKFFAEELTWKEAKKKCESLGGHLATIGSKEEDAFVAKLAADAGWKEAWIGATDEAEEGKWVWVDGLPALGPGAYTNWGPAQPNNKGMEEHYALLFGGQGWKWSDQPDRSRQHKPGFICEWDETR